MPRLGAIRLRDLSPEIVVRFRAELTRSGLGDATTRKVLTILQGVLQRAVEWRRIPANSCRTVRKPPQRRERAVRPMPPDQVEQMRGHLLARGRMRDAVLVSVLAYAGLRPGEALALTWGDIRERTILVERALALGRIKTTKTGQPEPSGFWLLSPRIWPSGDSHREDPTTALSSFPTKLGQPGAT